jgi:hypothetical protein
MDTKAKIKQQMVRRIETDKKTFKPNTRHDVRKVGEDINSYFNSCSILTGSFGAGKTFTALAECVAIAAEYPNKDIGPSEGPATHMLIFIKRKAYDPTLESTRALIEEYGCEVVEVGYEDAEEFVARIFELKNTYNLCKRAIHARRMDQPEPEEAEGIDDEVITEMFDGLNVRDFNAEWLNTLIVFDDASGSNLFKKTDSFFNNQLRILRDNNSIMFLTIHGLTTLAPQMKQNVAVIYVFRGLSRERQATIWHQCSIPLDFDEFRGAYLILSREEVGLRCLVCDNITGTYHCE